MRVRRREARDAYVSNLTSAWRRPVGDAAEPDYGASREQWQEHLRGPRTGTRGEKLDPNTALGVEKEREAWLGRDPAELARDVEARRRKQHAEFGERLSNAWRGGK